MTVVFLGESQLKRINFYPFVLLIGRTTTDIAEFELADIKQLKLPRNFYARMTMKYRRIGNRGHFALFVEAGIRDDRSTSISHHQ